MVSVDPERDTPERRRRARLLGFRVLRCHVSPEDTKRLTSDWGITATIREGGSQSGYLVDHDVSSYVIGPTGESPVYPIGFEPEDIAEDVRHCKISNSAPLRRIS